MHKVVLYIVSVYENMEALCMASIDYSIFCPTRSKHILDTKQSDQCGTLHAT